MRKSLVTLAFPMIVVAAACTGGGGDGDGTPYPFTSGTYVTSNAAILEDGCQTGDTPADYNGNLTDVLVTGSTIVVNSELTLARSGNTATGTVDETVDLNPTVDCILDVAGDTVAIITGTDQASVSSTTVVSQAGGADCAAIGIPLPCTNRLSFDVTKQ